MCSCRAIAAARSAQRAEPSRRAMTRLVVPSQGGVRRARFFYRSAKGARRRASRRFGVARGARRRARRRESSPLGSARARSRCGDSADQHVHPIVCAASSGNTSINAVVRSAQRPCGSAHGAERRGAPRFNGFPKGRRAPAAKGGLAQCLDARSRAAARRVPATRQAKKASLPDLCATKGHVLEAQRTNRFQDRLRHVLDAVSFTPPRHRAVVNIVISQSARTRWPPPRISRSSRPSRSLELPVQRARLVLQVDRLDVSP